MTHAPICRSPKPIRRANILDPVRNTLVEGGAALVVPLLRRVPKEGFGCWGAVHESRCSAKELVALSLEPSVTHLPKAAAERRVLSRG